MIKSLFTKIKGDWNFRNVLAENMRHDSKNGMTPRQKQMNEIIWLALIVWQVSHYSHLIVVEKIMKNTSCRENFIRK